jgi:hypothetical protein
LWASTGDWLRIDTDKFRLYYPKGHLDHAILAISALDEAKNIVSDYFTSVPVKHTVILEDYGQYANGFVSPVQLKTNLMLDSARFSVYENYIRFLSVHELTHVAEFYIGKNKNLLTTIFGDPLNPMIYLDSWILEGMSVLMESSYSLYEGRLNDQHVNGYFEYLAAQKKLKSFAELKINFLDSFPFGNSPYWYGGAFFLFLEDTYGKDKLKAFFLDFANRPISPYFAFLFPYFSIEKSAKRVFNQSFKSLYRSFTAEKSTSSQWMPSRGKMIETQSSFKEYLLVYADSLFMADTNRYHPEPGVFNHTHHLKKFNFNTQSWETVLPLFRNFAHPFEVQDHFLYATFQNNKLGFSNISNKQIGVVHDLVRINMRSNQYDILYSGRIDGYTIYKGKVFFSENKKWKRSTTLYGINLNQYSGAKTPLIHLPLAIYEMCALSDGVVGIGQLKTNQWVIFVWNPKHDYIETLFQSRWQISDLSTNDQEIVFSINKGDQIEIQKINYIKRQRYLIESEPYLFSGVLYNDRLIALNQVENGNHIVMQNSVSKLINNTFVSTKINHSLPNVSLNMIAARYGKYDVSENLKKSYPYYRSIFPLMLWGEDELRFLQYQMSYSNTGLSLLIDINYLLPLEARYEYKAVSHHLILSRQLYITARKGIQGIKVGHHVAYSNMKGYASLNLDILTHYAYQNHHGEFNIIVPYYDTVLGLRFPYYNQMSLTHRFKWKNSSVIGKLNQFNQPHDAFFGIRGFNNQRYMSDKEVEISVDVMHKLVSINQAISNPTMGIGSVFAGAYLEFLTQNDAQGAGVYLELELLWSTFNILNTISLGYGYLFDRYEHQDGTMFVEWELVL